MTKIFSLFSALLLCGFAARSQSFLPGVDMFSHKKTSYLTLTDGTKVEGEIDDIDRKKGLLKSVTINPTGGGKKKTYKAEAIQNMYLPPSGLDKAMKADDFLKDATQWQTVDLDKDILGRGYVYFEQVSVQISKKKVQNLMMQLVNPSFSSKVKAYYDPLADESIGIGIAGINVAGGLAKSYYLKKGNETAYLLRKKQYDDDFATLFGDCKALITKVGKNPAWADLAKHVYEYAQCK